LIVQGWVFDLVIWHKRNSPPLEDFVLVPVMNKDNVSRHGKRNRLERTLRAAIGGWFV